jgi:xanthosine utilization system XapX-like protein
VLRVVDIVEVSAIVAAAGVLVGVIYYILDIRHQSKVRQTDLTMRLYTSWVSEEMTKPFLKVWNLEFTDYDDFKKKYGTYLSDNPENAALLSVLNSFTVMGMLLQKKLVDHEIMSHLPVLMTWNKVKPIVEGVRKETNDPGWYEEFEYLYNEMKKLQQRGANNG